MKDWIREITETGKWIMEKNLSWGSSGNISAREGDKVYISASGTVLGELCEEDISEVDPDGNLLRGRRPSKELPMHLAVYRRCPEVNAVLHASPFWTTFAACMDMELKTRLFIESMRYDEGLLRIPYFHAGSRELSAAVSEIADRTRVILMEHHGVLVYGRELRECRNALEVTENLCRMNILAKSGGLSLNEVPEETAREFLKGGYYTG